MRNFYNICVYNNIILLFFNLIHLKSIEYYANYATRKKIALTKRNSLYSLVACC